MKQENTGFNDLRAYRDTLGQFATGVVVVTTHAEAGPVGMTINSFGSVSLTPPLILWSIERASKRFAYFAEAEHFAVHILRHDQKELAQGFAKGMDGFSELTLKLDGKAPLFDDCVGRLLCAQRKGYEGGDHKIILGEVIEFDNFGGAPLVFHSGQYRGLGEQL